MIRSNHPGFEVNNSALADHKKLLGHYYIGFAKTHNQLFIMSMATFEIKSCNPDSFLYY